MLHVFGIAVGLLISLFDPLSLYARSVYKPILSCTTIVPNPNKSPSMPSPMLPAISLPTTSSANILGEVGDYSVDRRGFAADTLQQAEGSLKHEHSCVIVGLIANS